MYQDPTWATEPGVELLFVAVDVADHGVLYDFLISAEVIQTVIVTGEADSPGKFMSLPTWRNSAFGYVQRSLLSQIKSYAQKLLAAFVADYKVANAKKPTPATPKSNTNNSAPAK